MILLIILQNKKYTWLNFGLIFINLATLFEIILFLNLFDFIIYLVFIFKPLYVSIIV